MVKITTPVLEFHHFHLSKTTAVSDPLVSRDFILATLFPITDFVLVILKYVMLKRSSKFSLSSLYIYMTYLESDTQLLL